MSDQPLRLASRPTELLDRDARVRFTFGGRAFSGFSGDTISSALWASGQRMISRSFKYHRPRADFTFDGSDPNALVQVGEEPNVRAARRPIADGMAVEPLNVFPSLGFDLLAVNGLLSRFLPVGFYYKAFHSKRLWPLYERVIRRAAGLGRLRDSAALEYDKRYAHTDVLVVGAGASGLAAAEAAAEAGARVLLVEREQFLGGGLQYAPSGVRDRAETQVSALVESVRAHPRIEVLGETTVVGCYDDHYLAAVSKRRLHKIRARGVVLATGRRGRIPVFSGNDVPGVMLESGALRLLNLYGVAPGRRPVVISQSDHGLWTACELADAGLSTAVFDERPKPEGAAASALQERGIPAYWEHRLEAVQGRRAVKAVRARTRDAVERVACDAVVVSLGQVADVDLAAQMGSKPAWDDAAQSFLARDLPDRTWTSGAAAGIEQPEARLEHGRWTGQTAAAALGFGSAPEDQVKLQPIDRPRASVARPGPGKFRFVDFAEDVTEKDVRDAVEEGYESSELLKRYTTVSMGPDQGRYGGLNGALVAAEAKGRPGADLGVTTARPPSYPTPLGVLGGRLLEPMRRSPIHHWHQERGCRWLNAGAWRRPERYDESDPVEAARHVREHVAIVDVSTLGKILLRGADASELLSRLYTNRWRKLGVGRVRYGVMCNEAGVIVDDGVTARLDEETYYTSLTTPNSDAVPRTIRWWLQQPGWDLDVQMANLTAAHAAINVAGPQSRALLERLCDDVDLDGDAFPFMSVRTAKIAGVSGWLLRIGYTGELSYEVHVPAGYGAHVWRALLEVGADLNVRPFDLDTLDILRMEKGHVIVGRDTDARSTPLEAGVSWAVKFDKPDFLGRAGLSRKRDSGRLREAFVGVRVLQTDTVPPEGAIFVARGAGGLEKLGRITSSNYSPALECPIAMGWIDAEKAEPGSRLQVRFDGATVDVEVVSMPFFDPEGERQR